MDGSRLSALVTGASSGVGRATAVALAERGYRLVLVSRSEAGLRSAEDLCTRAGAEVVVCPADIGDRNAVEAAFSTGVARFGRIDVVVQAAAAVVYGHFEDVPAEVFDRAMTTTVLGTANVARAALAHFRESERGHLVIIGSLLGKIAVPWMSGYVVGKWAVQALSRTLHIETKRSPDIHVSTVSPGSVNTPAYLLAANYAGFEGRPPPPIDPPEKVARAVLKTLDHPRRERSVGPFNGFVIAGFRLVPAVYDVLVTPLMKLGGLSRRPPADPNGSVFASTGRPVHMHGVWTRLGRRVSGDVGGVGFTGGPD